MPPKSAAFAVVVGLGALALVARRGGEPPPAADAGSPSTLERACAAFRNATPPPATPRDGGACAIVPRVHAALAGADPPEPELASLRRDVEVALAERATCAPALAEELAATHECGLAYDAVAIRLLVGPTADVPVAARLLARPSPCRWKALAALREAERVEPALARELLRAVDDRDRDVRGSAWLTFGTLGHVARAAGQAEAIACVDDVLRAELARVDRTRDDQATLVSAAGNAGCEACRPALHALATSADPSLRRTAVAALRFLPGEGDVALMCDTARRDADAAVRGAAAFALRHGRSSVESRLRCLFEVATEDVSATVAEDAVRSIGALAEGEPLGVGTLVEVARRASRPATKKAAVDALRGFATEQGIREALEAE